MIAADTIALEVPMDLATTKPAWLALGLVEMLAGAVTLAAPGLTAVPVPELVAGALAVCGIARLAHSWSLRGWDSFAGDVACGVLHLGAAGAILAYGRADVGNLEAIVGGWCIGVGAMGAATVARPPRVPDRQWLLGSSLQTIVLATAVNLLINGVAALIVGVDIHGVTRSVGPSAQSLASVV